ncbi:tRNA 2-selenouridine(34) synthase MnmH [Acaryochloris sp. IP29b_bin.137]|uniref:tRNA 2-selenouridine(34) synthase MnmH n=1 Tax=Acaryochloris sp. IP29b_bin.137 TaxID=2969217 RepID=UPI0026395DF1|nr:tRNA 2-selenouridine(34) synthase MnmH [Acaryochloris sp. IP29b_bin.137]
MPLTPNITTDLCSQAYSEIIDVRSPAEFAEDHLPGAVNLPVLDNQERAHVGTLYKQVSAFAARKQGAALVAHNLSRHLSHHFADKPKAYHPLIYCWRGGQRSQSMALVLTQVGWQTTLLDGGYKTYRAYVREQLNQLPYRFSYRMVCGLTGTAKTEILERLSRQDAQILQLEALANHRGSLLGAERNRQPSQKQFESDVLSVLQTFDPYRPVWVEAESSKIGERFVPQALWLQMKQAPCIEIQVPMAARVKWLLTHYAHFTLKPDLLKEKLHLLRRSYSKAQFQAWHQLIDEGAWSELVRSLLEKHYDPAYRRSMNRQYSNIQQTIQLQDLSSTSLETVVQSLATTRDVAITGK